MGFGTQVLRAVVASTATEGLRSAHVCPRQSPTAPIGTHSIPSPIFSSSTSPPKHVPDGRAGLGGLAEEEAEFLEGLGEGVFSRHDAGCVKNRSVRDGVSGRIPQRLSAWVGELTWGVSQWGVVRGWSWSKRWPWFTFEAAGIGWRWIGWVLCTK